MYTKSLSSVDKNDLQHAGQRAVDLAICAEQKISVPESFVVLAHALDAVVEHNKLQPKVDFLLQHLSKDDPRSLMNVYTSVRRQLNAAEIPADVEKELKDMYESLAAKGIGLDDGSHPLRVLLSTNAPEDPESNDTVIQNVQDFDEFIVAIREGWALAWLPSQLGYRQQYNFTEKHLKVAILVQVMGPATVSVHAHSAMPEDAAKIYLEVYYGYPDLREKVPKDFYAVTKDQLQVVLSELHIQPHQLTMAGKDLLVEPLPKKLKDDKIIKREIEEFARLTKKAERSLQSAVKVFFTVHDEQNTLLWVNRLPAELLHEDETPTEEVEVVDMEPEEAPDFAVVPEVDDTRSLNEALEEATHTPEGDFAQASHAAEEAIMEAAEHVEEVEEPVGVTGNMKLLAASYRMALNVIEKKYDEVFGQVGDEFPEMVASLNEREAFSRPVDIALLQIAGNAVAHGVELSESDYENIVDEITFVMQS